MPKQINSVRKYRNLQYSCSYHGRNDFRRIQVINAELAFLSPIFFTNSDVSKKPLGLLYSNILAYNLKVDCVALGGVDNNIRSLRGRNFVSVAGLSLLKVVSTK